ncbi:MAG: SIR2 family protein [Lachnospiraceae bacterium]|nr:SIR2 family protein [Lachnospiraceae bacterium]
MNYKDESKLNKNVLKKNIIASAHISFLFGAGVNGTALPQLRDFEQTKNKLAEWEVDTSKGIEEGIDNIEDDIKRECIKNIFIDEFKSYHENAVKKICSGKDKSIKNLEALLRKTYLIVQETQNRNPSMKQINIYTLNYDNIVEKVLLNRGYLYNSISASNTSNKSSLMDVIGYNYNVKKYIPTFMVSKLHGDIDKPIIPGKSKYKDMLNEDYFEVAFNMKEQLCRPNSILIVIGYSGKDNHINKMLEDCLNTGLTIYWYKYLATDIVPFENRVNVFVREQDDYTSIKDTTLVCYNDMENVWAEKLEK